jgi:hypothetical protein
LSVDVPRQLRAKPSEYDRPLPERAFRESHLAEQLTLFDPKSIIDGAYGTAPK